MRETMRVSSGKRGPVDFAPAASPPPFSTPPATLCYATSARSRSPPLPNLPHATLSNLLTSTEIIFITNYDRYKYIIYIVFSYTFLKMILSVFLLPFHTNQVIIIYG